MPLLNRIELLRDLSLTELLLASSQSALAAIAFICVFAAGSSNSLPLMLVRGKMVLHECNGTMHVKESKPGCSCMDWKLILQVSYIANFQGLRTFSLLVPIKHPLETAMEIPKSLKTNNHQ
ncbi:hypothetical protein OIU74_009444 [Salix koriyanagi]|uniref:Uncharacterized protein n=1 Tax=Salix koriyanagi TaxID=2511006 RepID=A0A9Q0TSA6_9ROSI|nr:hypothetical protein OIU74_009444 [Salix koriyanagi]